ncbi:hypothetical protein Zmor_011655 [Zophobas morio]|uniref:Peptidase S1 domain-containing protein n=1 Tax=Zophobas morio TaxID=2755281 RepID=A0AA38IU00_9CUCU|nr:hypothetical protein Zmor_011655 [Zophobas morio]
MKAVVLFAALVALVVAFPENRTLEDSGTDRTKPSPRIIGGKTAIPHSMPYQAHLVITGTTTIWACSGSVISNHYILTSGRCVEGGVQVEINLGVHDTSEVGPDQITYITRDILIHPDYSGNDASYLRNDIALLKTEYEIPFNDYIQPIALPNRVDLDDAETFEGHVGRASGWGLTNGGDDTTESTVLKYFDAKVIKNTDCKKSFFPYIDTTGICTSGDEGVGVCTGDVGGPLVADYKLIGVSSFWAILCIPGYPSGYTRVSSYIDWILENSDVVIA